MVLSCRVTHSVHGLAVTAMKTNQFPFLWCMGTCPATTDRTQNPMHLTSRYSHYMASSGLATTRIPIDFALPTICVHHACMDKLSFSSLLICMCVCVCGLGATGAQTCDVCGSGGMPTIYRFWARGENVMLSKPKTETGKLYQRRRNIGTK